MRPRTWKALPVKRIGDSKREQLVVSISQGSATLQRGGQSGPQGSGQGSHWIRPAPRPRTPFRVERYPTRKVIHYRGDVKNFAFVGRASGAML
jgi:hypothetical protein